MVVNKTTYIKIIFFVIVFIPINATIFAQTFTGFVKSDGGESLVGVSIIATASNGNIISYCISREKGRYKLSIPKDVYKNTTNVSISFMGFKKKEMPFSELENGMTIILEENNFQIKEIKVSAQRIKYSGDTLTYSVAGFKHAQDRTIADVIAKMPGLEVKSDGQISYQGKEINKFYIEGLDLMGSSYGIANKNLSADKVKSVQVLENHQMVKSLRGISFSDQAALNIVLKDDAKAVWAGSTDVGFGYGNDLLYDCRIMGVLFNKKFQTLMMYKNNNNGNRLENEVLDIDAIINGRAGKESGILSMANIEAPDLDESRYTFNNSHLIAGNWLWKIGKDSELRLQGNGIIDKTDLQSYNSTTYLTIAGLPVITEEQNITNTYSEWKGEINYQYNGSNTFIKNNIKGYIDFNKSIGSMLYNDELYERMAEPHKRYLSEDFQLSHTTRKSNVFNIESNFLYNNLPGQLLTINGTTEKLNLGFISSQNKIKYKIKIANHYLNNELGVNYDYQNIGVSMESNAELSNIYKFYRTYWTPSMSFLLGRQRLDMKLRLSYVQQEFQETSNNHIWIDPSLIWNCKVSAVSELSANINYTNSPIMGKSIYNTPIFTDYRTLTKNRGVIDSQQILSISTAYKYSNPIIGLFFNLHQLYNNSWGNILYQSNLENNIYSLTATDKEHNIQTIGLSTRISKTFSWAKLLIGLGATYNITNYKLLLDDNIDKARMNIAIVNFNYSMRPIQELSVEGKSSINLYEQKNLTHSDLSSGAAIDCRHALNFFVFPSKKIMFSLKNTLYHTNEEGIDLNYFLDIELRYKSKRWELALLTNNVIGTSKFERRTLGNTIEYYSITKLRPREFIAKISFDL